MPSWRRTDPFGETLGSIQWEQVLEQASVVKATGPLLQGTKECNGEPSRAESALDSMPRRSVGARVARQEASGPRVSSTCHDPAERPFGQTPRLGDPLVFWAHEANTPDKLKCTLFIKCKPFKDKRGSRP